MKVIWAYANGGDIDILVTEMGTVCRLVHHFVPRVKDLAESIGGNETA